MKLSILSTEEAASLAVHALGLPSEVIELTSPEGLAASLRRAASFSCPTSPSQLIDAVVGAIRPVSSPDGLSRDDVADLLDLMISSGDLLELRHHAGRSVRLLYLGPPSYIERQPGEYLLMGVRPFGAPLVDSELSEHIELEGHTRTVHLDSKMAAERLGACGLQQIDRERWVARPRAEAPQSLIERVAERLASAGASGEVENLVILDSAMPVKYYRGRWRSPKKGDTGDFVARRPQAYGADLWCVVRIQDGAPKRLVELPIDDPVVPARDEAWRLQMAIDAVRGKPQRFGVAPVGTAGAVVVKFFSPIPGLAERYLHLVGLPLPDVTGSLFSFRVPNGAMVSLDRVLADILWLERKEEEHDCGGAHNR